MGLRERPVSSSQRTDRIKQYVIYVTLEYCADDLFSGNGVCARSQVRGLSAKGVSLHVITGRPRDAPAPRDVDAPNGVTLHTCPLDVWRTTDRKSDYRSFAGQAANLLNSLVKSLTYLDAVMVVDWTGTGAIENMDNSLRASLFARTPLIYLNFRVYSRMTNISEEDRRFYFEAEKRSVQYAIDSSGGIMSLCKEDENALRIMCNDKMQMKTLPERDPFRIILPMLRDEFAGIAFRDKDKILDPTRRRMYFVCLVRLSKDKGPQRFVDVCAAISRTEPDFWDRTGVVPLLAGAASQPEFADALKKRFKQTVPCAVIIDEFLSSAQLASILQNAVLNLHPALYEAFGMTIVEAGSCGVPSIVHHKDIGASQLLRPEENEAIAAVVDNAEEVAKLCMNLLVEPLRLAHIGQKAYSAATSWTESAHVDALWKLVTDRQKMRLEHRFVVETE